MDFTMLRLRRQPRMISAAIDRPDRQNSINGVLLRELAEALDIAEADPDCRLFVLEGRPGVFCTGMDFSEVAEEPAAGTAGRDKAEAYMGLLRRMSASPKVVIACVDGKATAGGVGLVAAADLAIATEASQFSLSEALWGLLPACVIPYLIRRVGFQKAYAMTLTTLPASARESLAMGLVDEVAPDPADSIRRLLLRLGRLDERTIVDLKAYFRRMWIITESMEREAVAEITRLVGDDRVRENIREFVTHQRFPWSARDDRA